MVSANLDPEKSATDALQVFRECLEDTGEWVLLSDLDDPERGDVDVALSPSSWERLLGILHQRGNAAGWRILNSVDHEPTCRHAVLGDRRGNVESLDFCSDYMLGGRTFIPWQAFVSGKVESGEWPRPRPSVLFDYLFIKRLLKNRLDERCRSRLRGLFHQDPTGCREQLVRRLGSSGAARVLDSLHSSEDWATLGGGLGNELRRTLLDRHRPGIVQRLRERTGELARIIHRASEPTGLMVAVVGPDGTGKTTLIGDLWENLERRAIRPAYFHWRPDPWSRLSFQLPLAGEHIVKAESRPGAMARVASIPRLIRSTTLFQLGYLLRLWPARLRGVVVLSDRYCYGYQLAPRELRYFGPKWLARAAIAAIPSPDLVLYLSAPPEVIRRRKDELSLEEIHRQLTVADRLVQGNPRWRAVDATGTREEVLTRALDQIDGFLAERMELRLGRGST